MLLYDYYRSSAAYRVRIALHLKGIAYTSHAVSLIDGEQREPVYRAINPQGVVPALQTDGGSVLTQSLAVLEYLEETHPEPPLLPVAPLARARVRGLAQIVTCDIHPLQNLSVRQRLQTQHGLDAAAVDGWCRDFIVAGIQVLEARLSREPATGVFCHGDHVSLADLCIVPQLYNAVRYGVRLNDYPTLARIHAACERLPAFQAAHPHRQPDTPPELRQAARM